MVVASGRTPALATLQPAADHHLAGGINSVDLED
jgi:hypothetical protein